MFMIIYISKTANILKHIFIDVIIVYVMVKIAIMTLLNGGIQMRKRVLSFILVLCIACALLPYNSSAANNQNYALSLENTLENTLNKPEAFSALRQYVLNNGNNENGKYYYFKQLTANVHALFAYYPEVEQDFIAVQLIRVINDNSDATVSRHTTNHS